MKSNDIKKGMRLKLKNGWYATMQDNTRGNIRLAEVEGYFTETGSIYVWDIEAVKVKNKWISIELTDKQVKAQKSIEDLGGLF